MMLRDKIKQAIVNGGYQELPDTDAIEIAGLLAVNSELGNFDAEQFMEGKSDE